MVSSLRVAVEGWLEANPRRSLRMLSRLSNCGYSTIRKFMQGETEPLLDTALKIADIVMTKTDRVSFASAHVGLSRIAKTAHKTSDESLLELFAVNGYTPLLVLASHAEGTNEIEVRSRFGSNAVTKFWRLIDDGYLEKQGGNWRLAQDVGSVNRALTRSMLAELIASAEESNDGIDKASIAHVAWETVNEKTAIAVHDLKIRYIEELAELMNNKDNRGNVLVTYGMFFNVMKGEK